MSTPAYELEALYELEGEYEGEWEWEGEYESEAEYEGEEFFRRIAGLARRAVQSPGLRRVGLAAARAGLRGLGDVGAAIGGAPGSRGARIGRQLGGGVAGALGGLLPQNEFEYEFEGEGEFEYEGEFESEAVLNPIRRVYPDALMEHFGHAASVARSEAEAEAFLGALVPMVSGIGRLAGGLGSIGRAVGGIGRAAGSIGRLAGGGASIMRSASPLIRGVANVGRVLRRTPGARPLVRTIPTIVRRTAGSIAQQQRARGGRIVPPQQAVRTLARQTARVLMNPRQTAQALRRSRAGDMRYHRMLAAARRAAARGGGMPDAPPEEPFPDTIGGGPEPGVEGTGYGDDADGGGGLE